MSDASFLDVIDQLTREHPVIFHRDNGPTVASESGLLQQLRGAVFGGMESGGGGSSFGSKPPIDASALDLLNEITSQAAEALAIVSPRPTPYGQAEDYVRLWASQVDEDAVMVVTTKQTTDTHPPVVFDARLELTASRLANKWLGQVTAYLKPTEKSIPIDLPCPMCGTRWVPRSKDGEIVQVAALARTVSRETGASLGASCAVNECRASWTPAEFERLGVLLGTIQEVPDTP